MTYRELHDGRQDGLRPLESLDLNRCRTFADLVRAMGRTAFGGRQLGRAFEILLTMFRDPQCTVVLTVSGAMTVAKQGSIICELIDRGLVDVVVATGALITHGLSESIGLVHYEYDEHAQDDTELFRKGYNRIYDTLEMEANLNEVQLLVARVLREVEPPGGVWSSARLCRELGRRLAEDGRDRAILRSAFEQDVPVFIPAFTDSELALDVSIHFMDGRLRELSKLDDEEAVLERLDRLFQATPPFNPFLDLQQYASIAAHAERLGIFTIGGGVPRNWAQQVAPYLDIIAERLGLEVPRNRFRYGVRICPEPVHWGGLSGCTYMEGVSWGKFVPPSEGGRFAEVFADATLVWPLLMKAVFEQLDGDDR